MLFRSGNLSGMVKWAFSWEEKIFMRSSFLKNKNALHPDARDERHAFRGTTRIYTLTVYAQNPSIGGQPSMSPWPLRGESSTFSGSPFSPVRLLSLRRRECYFPFPCVYRSLFIPYSSRKSKWFPYCGGKRAMLYLKPLRSSSKEMVEWKSRSWLRK